MAGTPTPVVVNVSLMGPERDFDRGVCGDSRVDVG